MTERSSASTDPADLPRKAEERLKERPAVAPTATPEDLDRLVHNLQVHQIELEMQNDELRRTEAALGVLGEKAGGGTS